MRELDELTDLVDGLNEAESFADSASRLVAWARTITGSETALLRVNERDPEGRVWLPTCCAEGATEGFVRDEALFPGDQCMCGVVSRGNAPLKGPFFTPHGSFTSGRLGAVSREALTATVGTLRGRCVKEGYQSIAVVPLEGPDGPVGCLHLADRRPDLFAAAVLELVEAGARVAGRFLLKHDAREREHEAFAAIQGALLPPVPPPVAGLELGVCFASATDIASIGGDFYDVVDRGDRGLALMVGDYSGHGIEAAGMAAHARYVLANHARHTTSPGEILAAANADLCDVLPDDHFVSAAVCVLYPSTGRAHIALAGHPPPIRLVQDGAAEVEMPCNHPLGMFAGARFGHAQMQLAPDEYLLLVTDGIIEARRGGRLFGIEGVAEVWRSVDARSPAALARALCEASDSYHDPARAGDDRLALAVSLARGW